MDGKPVEAGPENGLTEAACRRRGWLVLSGLILTLLAATLVLTVFNADLRVAARFYDADRGWYLGDAQPWQWLYHYGTIPGLLVTLAALAGWFVSRLRPSLQAWRPYFLLVVLTAVIASGILVNAFLKPYWGRPRPDQITQFGGQWNYRDVHQPGTPGQGSSFPCGHCAMGFTLVSLFFVYRRSRILAYAGGGAGLLLGGALSVTRILQGAHFLTDTLWSLGLNLIVAAALYYLVLAIPVRKAVGEDQPVKHKQRPWFIAGLVICIAITVGAFATRRPFYAGHLKPVDIPPEIKYLIVRLNTPTERFNVKTSDDGQARIRLDAHGFGWLDFDHRVTFDRVREGDTLVLEYRINPVSYFAELYHAVELQLPARYRERLDVRLESGRTDENGEKAVP